MVQKKREKKGGAVASLGKASHLFSATPGASFSHRTALTTVSAYEVMSRCERIWRFACILEVAVSSAILSDKAGLSLGAFNLYEAASAPNYGAARYSHNLE